MIYHLQTGALEKWPWHCDRVALSPRTQRLATWCSSTTGEARFAVMEWGGEIWHSDAAPTTEIVHGLKLSLDKWIIDWIQTWAWSADGQQVAYFDPTDPAGYLYIANSTGVRLKILPGAVRDLGEKDLVFPDDLQWSQDGRRLLVLAYSSTEHTCPRVGGIAEDKPRESPCRQVVDTQTGEVLWSFGDSFEQIAALMHLYDAERAVAGTGGPATISPDGNIVVFTVTAFGKGLSVAVDISRGNQVIPFIQTGTMRWR
jgi:hypothetical protein